MIIKTTKAVNPTKKVNSFFLIGLMGSGKSTVGRELSQRLKNYQFIDSDRAIEERSGVDISYIFDLEGEKGFRVREETIIQELSRIGNIVLSTGGGAILSFANRQALSNGLVIFLKIKPETIVARLKDDQSRPLLQGDNRLQILEELIETREQYYVECADYIIMVDDLTPKQVVELIIRKVVNKNEET